MKTTPFKSSLALILALTLALVTLLVLLTATASAAPAERPLPPEAEQALPGDDGPLHPQQFFWEKWIDDGSGEIPWVPDIAITLQTSDTFIIRDTVILEVPASFELFENWIPDELTLVYWETIPPMVGSVDQGDDHLYWTVVDPPAEPGEYTLIKEFHVEPCDWDWTTLWEELWINFEPWDSRPVIINKIPPILQIDSVYDPEVLAGETVTFMLNYGNTGGLENNVWITNTFPDSAPFDSSVPPADNVGPGDLSAGWFIGDLEMDEFGSIVVTVTIQPGLEVSTTIEIWDYIYDHMGVERDDTRIELHIAPLEFGDAPEGNTAVAYPSTGVTGAFPTCMTIGPAGWIQHELGWAHFGPAWDAETDGNAGLCPNCFPTYDDDECFADGDAGLMFPEPYTIDLTPAVVTCPNSNGTPLGATCQTAVWGTDVDISVTNNMPVVGYVNVLMDWNQDGQWAFDPSSTCPGPVPVPEHVLVDFAVPPQYSGPLSALMPPGSSFTIGPNPGYVWTRFSITERPVGDDWTGEGDFEDGETEDYLLEIEEPGTIIVEKQTDPDGAPDSFTFTGDAPGTIVDGGTIVSPNLPAGTYYATEIIPAGWTLTDILCSDANSTGSVAGQTATFRLEAGETVTCTFYNYLPLDYGDAPDSYGTLLASDGARHQIVQGHLMGPQVDAEPDGQPVPPGLGDDLNNLADEDGVAFLTPLTQGGPVLVMVDGGLSGGNLDAWIDFDGNGVFDHPGEQIFPSVWLNPGAGNILAFVVPAGAQPGTTYARFRLSMAGSLGPTGFAPDGEVEDYQVEIERGTGDITIIKDAEPPDGTDFAFSGDLGGFTLDDADPDDNDQIQDRKHFNVPTGNYDVIETIPPGWGLTEVSCEGGDYTLIPNGVTIHLLCANEHITCTFHDRLAAPVGGTTAPASTFDLLLPWLSLAALVAVIAGAVALKKRSA